MIRRAEHSQRTHVTWDVIIDAACIDDAEQNEEDFPGAPTDRVEARAAVVAALERACLTVERVLADGLEFWCINGSTHRLQQEAEVQGQPELTLINPYLYVPDTEPCDPEFLQQLHSLYFGGRAGRPLSAAPFRMHDSVSDVFLHLSSLQRQRLVLAALSSAPRESTVGPGRHCERQECVSEAWPGGAGLVIPQLRQIRVLRGLVLAHHDDERAAVLSFWTTGAHSMPFGSLLDFLFERPPVDDAWPSPVTENPRLVMRGLTAPASAAMSVHNPDSIFAVPQSMDADDDGSGADSARSGGGFAADHSLVSPAGVSPAGLTAADVSLALLSPAAARCTRHRATLLLQKYFGAGVALFVSLVAFLAAFSLIPATAGLAVWLYQLVLGLDADNWLVHPFATLVVLWAAVLVRRWVRKTAELLFVWDESMASTSLADDGADLNPCFRPDSLLRNPFAGQRLEGAESNTYLRPLRTAVTSLAVVLFVLWSIALQAVLWAARTMELWSMAAQSWLFSSTGAELPTVVAEVAAGVLFGLGSLLLEELFSRAAESMTRWENHRTMRSHTRSLFIKTVIFLIFNTYLFPFYLAFYERRLGHASWFLGATLVIRELVACIHTVLVVPSRARAAITAATTKPPPAAADDGEGDGDTGPVAKRVAQRAAKMRAAQEAEERRQREAAELFQEETRGFRCGDELLCCCC
jgi:hypothetical protein